MTVLAFRASCRCAARTIDKYNRYTAGLRNSPPVFRGGALQPVPDTGTSELCGKRSEMGGMKAHVLAESLVQFFPKNKRWRGRLP